MESRLNQKRFIFGTTFLIIISLLIIRYFVLPYFGQKDTIDFLAITTSVIDNLFIASVTYGILSFVTFWLIDEYTINKSEVIQPREIRKLMKSAINETDEWWYSGHIGRHFRAVTLPQLAQEARQENLTKHIKLIILNPSDVNLCESYAVFRNGVRSATKDNKWDAQRVSHELMATIVTSYAWAHQEPLIDLTVILINQISVFRIDLSSRVVLITKEDPLDPALKYDANTLFYNSYKQELVTRGSQGQSLPKGISFISLEKLNVESMQNLVKTLDIKRDFDKDLDYQRIIKICQGAKNPYA